MIVIHPTTRTELTDSDKASINCFYELLTNGGVKQILADSGRSNLNYAFADGTYHVSDPAAAAVSLWICVGRARRASIIPDDLLPTDEVLQVCLNIFFGRIRDRFKEPITD